MTELQSLGFVQTEIVPRTWRLTDVNVTDWARAVKRVPSVEQARAIVLDIIDDPKVGKLTLKDFQRRTCGASRRARPDSLVEPYEGAVRCLTAPASHPEWEGRQWAVVIPGAICTRTREARAWVDARAAEIQDREGGRWCGVLARTVDDDGLCGRAAMAEAERRILAGPDTPGRRFLCRLRTAAPGSRDAQLRRVLEANATEPWERG